MSVEPLLQVGFSPGLIQPVARVRSRLAGLLSNGLISLADLLKQRIPLAWLRNRNPMTIGKRLELAISPGIQNPILDIGPRILGLLL